MSVAELIGICLFTIGMVISGVLAMERNRYAGCAILSFPAALWVVIIVRVAMDQ